MGRSPDFLNSAVMAFDSAAAFVEQTDHRFADYIAAVARRCRIEDPHQRA